MFAYIVYLSLDNEHILFLFVRQHLFFFFFHSLKIIRNQLRYILSCPRLKQKLSMLLLLTFVLSTLWLYFRHYLSSLLSPAFSGLSNVPKADKISIIFSLTKNSVLNINDIIFVIFVFVVSSREMKRLLCLPWLLYDQRKINHVSLTQQSLPSTPTPHVLCLT